MNKYPDIKDTRDVIADKKENSKIILRDNHQVIEDIVVNLKELTVLEEQIISKTANQ